MARIGETFLHGAVDGALELVGHQEAAVGIGADGERLGFQVAQVRGFALADVAVEGGACAGGLRRSGRPGPPRCGRADFSARSSTTRLVSSSARSMRASWSVVTTSADRRRSSWPRRSSLAVLEGLEGAHEVAEGGVEVVGGFGFEVGVHGGPLYGWGVIPEFAVSEYRGTQRCMSSGCWVPALALAHEPG